MGLQTVYVHIELACGLSQLDPTPPRQPTSYKAFGSSCESDLFCLDTLPQMPSQRSQLPARRQNINQKVSVPSAVGPQVRIRINTSNSQQFQTVSIQRKETTTTKT